MLLACYGLSFFFHYDKPIVTRLDALTAKVEELVQRPDRIGEVIAKLDDLNSASRRNAGGVAARPASNEESLEELKRKPIISGNPGNHGTTINGSVISKQVTVFQSVRHEGGTVVTGWRYPDGASANQQPTYQFCYWSSDYLNFTTSHPTIDIATNGMRLPNIGAGVPRLEDALQKCIWWNGSSVNY